MIAKSLIAAAAIAASLTALAPVEQAQAKVHVDLYANLGGGFGPGFYPGYGYGGGYGGGYYPVIDPYYGGGISCNKGRKIVNWAGFHNVHAFDCSAPVYQYKAWKFGNPYKVRVGISGDILSAHPL